jgi:uncharacterized membrane protein (GlpM family)
MLTQILIRVIVGGIIVSIFAVLSDTLKPKSFAGLFGAPPSVALTTIVLTVAKEGRNYAAIEARLDDPGCGRFLSICLRRISFPDSRKVVGSAGYAHDSVGLVCFCLWPTAGTSQMIVTVRPSTIVGIRWYEYASRFIFGGLATAIAGVIAKEYGPSVGGLFLAFPQFFQPAQRWSSSMKSGGNSALGARELTWTKSRPHSTPLEPASAHLDSSHSHVWPGN